MNTSPLVLPTLVAAGAVIGGKYRLVERLGEGGIAEVWEAVNVDLDAPVAVKVCRPDMADPTSVQRLIQEARAAARLMHPSIVRVYDTGLTEQGAPYVVMERLRGVNLRVEIERDGPIDLLYIVNTMIAVADALELAHRHGVIHRDVKPDNIFLAEVDAGRVQPKLLDFGIIKIEGYKTNLTKTGTTLGSPAYMAPEQAAGESDVDARADVWSACVVLFEALTRRLPFEAANYNALMRSILSDPVPNVLGSFADAAPLTPFSTAIGRVVQRGLSKERSARWQSAGELRDALIDCVHLVLPKESSSQGSITAYHLVRASTVPKDAATVNQWSAAHESATDVIPVRSSRWAIAGVAALLICGAALAWSVVVETGPRTPAAASPTTVTRDDAHTASQTRTPQAVTLANSPAAPISPSVLAPVPTPSLTSAVSPIPRAGAVERTRAVVPSRPTSPLTANRKSLGVTPSVPSTVPAKPAHEAIKSSDELGLKEAY